MLQCYIIDDELPAINIIKSYVQKTPNLELVGSNTNALEALSLLNGQQVDLLFLDIEHFLRGRQTTDANGNASFISIYPGWYPGRAPHIHVEVLNSNGSSLLVSQIAFPEDTSNTVYASQGYNGNFDTPNSSDGEFEDSLARNIADSVTGNTSDGYTLNKVIKVAG